MAYNPFSWVIKSMSLLEKRLVKNNQSPLDKINEEFEAATGEETTVEEKEMIKGLVKFGKTSVKQIMKSRIDITAFSSEQTFGEVLEKISKHGFSRIPVYKDGIDNVEGILNIKDLFPYIKEQYNPDFDWLKLLRPAYFIPETKKIEELLKDFQQMRQHMAIVVNEYGGVAGLVTLEDIIEEIVGEIADEFDEEDQAYIKINDNSWLFEGKISLNDFCKVFDLDPSVFEEVKGEAESLGGLLLQLNSDLPELGDKIMFERFLFTVESVNNKTIKKVKVSIVEANEVNETGS
jgi:putative hemolysin